MNTFSKISFSDCKGWAFYVAILSCLVLISCADNNDAQPESNTSTGVIQGEEILCDEDCKTL